MGAHSLMEYVTIDTKRVEKGHCLSTCLRVVGVLGGDFKNSQLDSWENMGSNLEEIDSINRGVVIKKMTWQTYL